MIIYPFVSGGLFYLTSLDRSIFYIRRVWLVSLLLLLLLLPCFVEMYVFKEKSEESDRVWSDSTLFAYVPFMGRQP